jgi:hypothetical protein
MKTFGVDRNGPGRPNPATNKHPFEDNTRRAERAIALRTEPVYRRVLFVYSHENSTGMRSSVRRASLC